MPIAVIDVGTSSRFDPTADTMRQAFIKCNNNFAYLDGQFLSGFVTNAQVNSYFADPSNNGSFSPSTWRTELSVYSTAQVDAYFADPSTNGSFSASTWRGDLGLGTMATQNASAVAITGGTITGITDLAIADGGTGASTAPNARTNLGLGTIATQDANNVSITGGTISGVSGTSLSGIAILAAANTFTDDQTINSGGISQFTLTGTGYAFVSISGGSNEWLIVTDAANSDLLFESSTTSNQLGIDSTSGLFFDGLAYINFSTTNGASGFGLRNNSGAIEKKNSGGSWQPIAVTTADNDFTVPQSLPGVTNASSATAGDLGEFVEDAESSGVSVGGSATTVCSISLTAGDWDVQGQLLFDQTDPAAGNNIYGGISLVNNTLPTIERQVVGYITSNGSMTLTMSRVRINVSTTTTVYLVGRSDTGETSGCFGFLNARRVR